MIGFNLSVFNFVGRQAGHAKCWKVLKDADCAGIHVKMKVLESDERSANAGGTIVANVGESRLCGKIKIVQETKDSLSLPRCWKEIENQALPPQQQQLQ